MAFDKPDLTRVWAENAPADNVVDPDVTAPGKVEDGWQVETLPYQFLNFIQKWQTQGLAYNNQQGINEWDAQTEYPVGGIAKASDNRLYQAKVEQAGNNPVSSPTEWDLLTIPAAQNIVSVEDFGAVGDGVTDDLAAFNAAEVYINNLGGGVIYALGNNYAFSDVFIITAASTQLIGSGSGVAIRGTGTFNSTNLIRLPGGDPDEPVVLIRSTTTLKMSGFMVDGKGLCAGVNLRACSNCVLEDIAIKDVIDVGLAIGDSDITNGVTYCTASRIYIEDNVVATGIRLNECTFGNLSSLRITHENLTGLEISENSSNNNVDNVECIRTIANNNDNYNISIEAGSDNNRIIGSVIEDLQLDGNGNYVEYYKDVLPYNIIPDLPSTTSNSTWKNTYSFNDGTNQYPGADITNFPLQIFNLENGFIELRGGRNIATTATNVTEIRTVELPFVFSSTASGSAYVTANARVITGGASRAVVVNAALEAGNFGSITLRVTDVGSSFGLTDIQYTIRATRINNVNPGFPNTP